jgi:predicted kinase
MFHYMTGIAGSPGSGKSTWVQRHGGNAEHIVLDDYFERDETGQRFWTEGGVKIYWKEKFTSHQFVEGMAYLWDRYLKALRDGKDIIVESPFASHGSRIGVACVAKAFGYRTKLIWFDLPLSEVLLRNKNRIDFIPEEKIASFHLKREEPIFSEGWDEIERIEGV